MEPVIHPEGTVLRRWYEVRIIERTEVACTVKDWKQVRDEPIDGKGTYDHVYSPGSRIEESTRFEQRADAVDIRHVICAVNGLEMPRIEYHGAPPTFEVPDLEPPVVHGKSCFKVGHDSKQAYGHDVRDDTLYDVDGVSYCGRCHVYLPR